MKLLTKIRNSDDEISCIPPDLQLLANYENCSITRNMYFNLLINKQKLWKIKFVIILKLLNIIVTLNFIIWPRSVGPVRLRRKHETIFRTHGQSELLPTSGIRSLICRSIICDFSCKSWCFIYDIIENILIIQ